MKILLSILLLIITMNSFAQNINQKIQDDVKHKEILINTCNRSGLMTFPEFKSMYDPLYAAYQPDSSTMAALKKLVKKEKIKIIFGSWCEDSKVNLPHFFKILDELKFKDQDVELIAVDGNKKAGHGLIDGLNVDRVPTFIIYNAKGKEIGRIIEGPKTTLEGDLLAIYQHQ